MVRKSKVVEEQTVEQELLEATGFKPKKKYGDRQDYLAAFARACDGLSDKEFDKLSDAAADWCNGAFGAIKDKEEIPDFPDAEPEAQEEEAPRRRGRGKAKDADDGDGDDDGDSSEDDGDGEEAPRRRGRGKAKEEKAKPAPAGKKGKSEKPEKAPRGKPEKAPRGKSEKKESAGVNRYGIRLGTNAATAIEMFEKGAPMRKVKDATGTNHYNLLTRLVDEGHKVSHLEGVIKVTHKEDAKAEKKARR
jgi:hypothetical protein